jgi:sugar O-acyltransferase (sialic acid O-acetyltransferase NeuD family)
MVRISRGRALQRVVIYGARGFPREVEQLVKDAARAGESLTCAGFLTDPEFLDAAVSRGIPVLGSMDWLAEHADVRVAIAIGATAPRRRIANEIARRWGNRFVTLRHPTAVLGESVAIGDGSIVCAGAIALADISVGAHSQLHVGCTVGHDSVLGDFVTIAPNATVSGRVVIGEGTFVGAGSTVLPNVKIGRWVTVGAGAVVTGDVAANSTVFGTPARPVRAAQPHD